MFNHRAIRNTIWIHTPLPSYQSLSTIAYWERCQNSVCPHSPHQFPKEYIIYLLKNPQRAQQTEPGRYCLCHVYMETYFVGSSVSKPSASSRLLSNINILCWSKFISCFHQDRPSFQVTVLSCGVSVIKCNKQLLIIFKAVEFVHLTFGISFFLTNFPVYVFAKCIKVQFWMANEKISVTLVHPLILPQLLKQSRPKPLQEDVFLSLTGFIIWTLSALNQPLHQCLCWSQRRKIVLSSFIFFPHLFLHLSVKQPRLGEPSR